VNDRDKHESMADQFPHRPQHPDFDRLQRVVAWLEDLKMSGALPEEVYAQYMDMRSVAYVAVNRSAIDTPQDRSVFTCKNVVEHASNAWMEGFLFGLRFQQFTEEEGK
jgi:hypothetical protein